MSAEHDGHDHQHPGMAEDAELGPIARRAGAIESLLVEKGSLHRPGNTAGGTNQ